MLANALANPFKKFSEKIKLVQEEGNILIFLGKSLQLLDALITNQMDNEVNMILIYFLTSLRGLESNHRDNFIW